MSIESDRAQAELRRQRAGDQRNGADQAGVQNAAEAGDAVRQHHAVDAELHIGVIVADVEAAAGRGILRHAGRLQQHLLDRRIGALRQRVDGGVGLRVRCGADGRVQIAAALVEGIVFRRHLFCRRQRRHRRGRGRTRNRRRARLRFRPVLVTSTSGSSACATAASLKPIKASSAVPPSTYVRRTERTDMTLTPNVACIARHVGGRAVAANKEEKELPRLACGHRRRRQDQISAAMPKPAPTGGQAAGGARDWNAARRGTMKIAATRSNCSIACEAAGSGKDGAVAANELPSNEMAAQMAQ